MAPHDSAPDGPRTPWWRRAAVPTGPRRAAVATLTAGALLVGSPLSGAFAAPTPGPTAPSAQDVHAAQQAVTAAAGDVAAMEVRLAQLSAVADDAQVAVDRAGENYTQALADAQAAQQAADEAAAQSHQADSDAETARQNLMAYAREMARSGGTADTLEAVLSANGFQDVAERTADLSLLTGKADASVQGYRAAQLVASTMDSRAQAAAQAAAGKQADAQAALQTAQKAQSDSQAQVAAASSERDALIAKLAQAQKTSVDTERAHQDQIDRERKQREDDAAKAARLAAASTPPASGGSSSGSTGGSSAGHSGTSPSKPSGGSSTPPSGGSSAKPSGGSSGSDSGTGSSGSSGSGSSGTGSSGGSGLGSGVSRGSAAMGQAAVAWAKTQIGKPYVWGASGPSSYDCSGLTMSSWRNAGVSLNRTSRDQYKQVLKISYDSLRPGDLVFWTSDPSDPDAIYHVAMWAGNGQIVEAPAPGEQVRLTTMRWANTMPYAGRP